MSEIADYFIKFAENFKRLNSKLLLLKLLDKAKAEYDSLDFISGKKSLEEALKFDENNPVTLRGLGCIAQFEGEIEKAIQYFKKALENSHKKEIEYTLLGMAYYLEDELEEAISCFNKAIDENDNYTQAYEGRNQAMLEHHLKIVDLQEALKKYL